MKIVIALAIAMFMSAGFTVAAETEFTIVKTAVRPVSSLSVTGILPMVSAAQKINLDPHREFSGFLRGEKLESALFQSSLMAITALNVADDLSRRQA